MGKLEEEGRRLYQQSETGSMRIKTLGRLEGEDRENSKDKTCVESFRDVDS